MVSLKQVLMLAMAAVVTATPVITESAKAALVKDSIDAVNTTPKDEIFARSGACSQGDCPDFDQGVDLIFQWTVIPQPGFEGAPPIPLVTQEWHGRWNDCNQCGRVSTSEDGCFSFTGCGRKQSVCIDDKNNRMHRIWQDNGAKMCWGIKSNDLGGCGFIKEALIFSPTDEIPCNW